MVLHASGTGAGTQRPDFWDIPKGLLDGGEKGIDAARREVQEETGITNIGLVSDFKETVRYFTRREGKPIPKFIAVFFGEVKDDAVALSWEHDRFEWLPYDAARERLTRKEMKDALVKAEAFLTAPEFLRS